ncbi:hypothetical protein DICVIV_03502 [Dictyocaulus viviparus]|uniref:EamA domain-containing protein n=1 Tax=Dictyocaulus viviparus TaxID=29172 RepID=A0A0D8Y2S1_DICVI|nr:hypothetical protein DICVIV_03502 [Dictyocaulus viviparus]
MFVAVKGYDAGDGNTTAIPLIRRIGMAVGLFIWSSTKCVTGWVTSRFGMFGMKSNEPASHTLNYLGLISVLLGGVMFSLIKKENVEDKAMKIDEVDRDVEGISIKMNVNAKNDSRGSDESEDEELLRTTISLPNNQQFAVVGGVERIICVIIALLAGVFYGLTFVPVIYMIDNRDRYPNYPDNGLAYVFSHFFGIFLTATTVLVIYALWKKNQLYAPPDIVLPSFLGGLLWATAQTSFFVANQYLSQAISFPIITGLPGCVASMWSILYFKEIKGQQNFCIFSLASLLTMIGVVLVGMSKELRMQYFTIEIINVEDIRKHMVNMWSLNSLLGSGHSRSKQFFKMVHQYVFILLSHSKTSK